MLTSLPGKAANFKELMNLIDSINIKIISELVKDPAASSLSLSKKLRIPLSSLQRRRAKLEKLVLAKVYHVNLKVFGGKIGEIIIKVEKGKSREVAQEILKKYKNNVMSVSTRINTEHNVSAQLIYKDTAELHDLLESIRSMLYVTNLQWSEIVETLGDNSSSAVVAFFNQLGVLGLHDGTALRSSRR